MPWQLSMPWPAPGLPPLVAIALATIGPADFPDPRRPDPRRPDPRQSDPRHPDPRAGRDRNARARAAPAAALTDVPAHAETPAHARISVDTEVSLETDAATGGGGAASDGRVGPGTGTRLGADRQTAGSLGGHRPAAEADADDGDPEIRGGGGPPDRVVNLVRRAQQGESDAFGELYDLYVRLVYQYVTFRVRGPSTAEDIVSETFLRAWRRIGTFNWQGRDIGAWFITIAKNLIIDDAKSSRSRLEVPVDDLATTAGERAVDGPEETVLAVVTRRAVLEAVRALKAEQRECVLLRFVEGLSVRETALAMGKNEGAIKALQFRAVRSLARAVPRALEL